MAALGVELTAEDRAELDALSDQVRGTRYPDMSSVNR